VTRRGQRPTTASPSGANLHCALCGRIICRIIDGGDGFADLRRGARVEAIEGNRIALWCPSAGCDRHQKPHVVDPNRIVEAWRAELKSGGRTQNLDLGVVMRAQRPGP